jgi:hypothetical protein
MMAPDASLSPANNSIGLVDRFTHRCTSELSCGRALALLVLSTSGAATMDHCVGVSENSSADAAMNPANGFASKRDQSAALFRLLRPRLTARQPPAWLLSFLGHPPGLNPMFEPSFCHGADCIKTGAGSGTGGTMVAYDPHRSSGSQLDHSQ